jgi:hypothetical protein
VKTQLLPSDWLLGEAEQGAKTVPFCVTWCEHDRKTTWFFEERALAFAKLMLTARHNVRPYAGTDMAIDLKVEIPTHGNSTPQRRFGVRIVAYMDLPDTKDADARVLSHLGRNSFEAALPICAFVIGVRLPEGIYRWVVEPVVEDGRPALRQVALSRRDVGATWQTLDETGAARLID